MTTASLKRADVALAAALAALAAAFILPGLGAQALANWDEATYGAIAREFLRRPALTLYYDGVPFSPLKCNTLKRAASLRRAQT